MEDDNVLFSLFNVDETFRMIQDASGFRQHLIGSVFRMFQELQIEDIHTRETSRLGAYTLWLTAEDSEIPNQEGRPQSSMAFAVASADRSERLRFHVPVAKDFDRDKLEALEAMAPPSFIGVERQSYAGKERDSKTTLRLILGANRLYFYRTLIDTQDEEELYDVDGLLQPELNRGFDSHIGLVATINEELINWQMVKQREINRLPGGVVQARDI